MTDETDSWLQKAFGVDLNQSLDNIKEAASARLEQAGTTITEAAGGLEGAVGSAFSAVAGAAAGVAGKALNAPGSSGSAAGGEGGAGTGSFPLAGSVGRGGRNASADVRAVQAALGIAVDGQCGGQTIAAIEQFQRQLGQPRPDGRVDAGGATERALGSGSKVSAASEARPADGSASVLEGALQGAEGLAGRLAGLAEPEVDAARSFVSGLVQEGGKALADPGVFLEQARPPEAGAADAGAPDAASADAGGASDPNFQDIDDPFSVRADDPAAFVNKANEYLGKGIAGHMATAPLDISKSAEFDVKGRLTRANLLVRTTTVRPRFGGGRTIGDERAVIDQAEELVRAHEERHREIMKNGMRVAVAKMRGQTREEAEKTLVRAIADVDKAQNNLDDREGEIEILQSQGRMTGARLVPRRASK